MRRESPSRGPRTGVLRAFLRFPPRQVAATILIYAFYGCLIGAALFPSALLALRVYHRLFDVPSLPATAGRLLLP